jgi:ATP-binding cassette subfamily B protein
VRIVKAYGRQDAMIARYDRQAEQLRGTMVLGVRTRAFTWTWLHLLPNLAIAVITLLGGLAVIHGQLTVGGLVAFTAYLSMLVGPMDMLGWVISMLEEAATAAARVYEVLDTVPEIADVPGAVALPPGPGEVTFEHVWFRHAGTGGFVLADLTLRVAAGETVALVGRTGSGKTTVANLLPRLYDPDKGRVLIDGHDIAAVTLQSLRTSVAVAFEDPVLFSASVRENLVMGRPGITEADVDDALTTAQARFVHDLPWGLDTRIGEQGYTLSGGQRQRLALARAILGRPRVLVLDDPLSSVDVHTEAVIEQALERVLAGVTALLVAHRPSTLALADRVALIDGGRVVATGTHTELMRTSRLYRAILWEGAGDSDSAGELDAEVSA